MLIEKMSYLEEGRVMSKLGETSGTIHDSRVREEPDARDDADFQVEPSVSAVLSTQQRKKKER